MKTCLRLMMLLCANGLAGLLQMQAQSISLAPMSINPSVFNITVSTAGANPSLTLLNNYTTQKVKYSWPLFGDGIVGYVSVKAETLPPGIGMTVQATGSSGWLGLNGSSTGTVTVGSSYQSIISGIIMANNINRGMTQYITISDFSQLRPGSYAVIVSYQLQ